VVIDSDRIPDDVARAIQELWIDAGGRLRVRLHSKLAALESLAKYAAPRAGEQAAASVDRAITGSGPGVIDAREAFRRYGGAVVGKEQK
jgi:hypothetical protein